MTHNIHILLGSSAEQNISRIREYTIKYGDEYVDEEGNLASQYLQMMLYADDGQFLVAQKKKQDESVFTLGIEDRYAVELVPCKFVVGENRPAALVAFFRRLFLDTVNLQAPGDDCVLHVSIHVPLYSEDAWAKAQELIGAIDAAKAANYKVDLVLLASDLIHVLEKEEDVSDDRLDEYDAIANQILKDIVNLKVSGKCGVLQNLLLVQNQNDSGVALNLDKESYANVMGEYALATTAYRSNIFSANFLVDTQQHYPLLGIGISMLHFDRFYFVQYMLRKAYSHILRREGIDRDKVDIDTVSGIVQSVLKPNINIFSAIFDREVKPRLERKMSQEDIMAEIQPILKEEMARLQEEFLSYMDREDLSLPAKRVTLAQLLGEDDEMMQGELFQEDQLIIDECRREVLDLFVDANNRLADIDEGITDAEGQPLRNYASLSDESGVRVETARDRLRKIKQTKMLIKESTDYIRNQSAMLERLNDSEAKEGERHKRLTEGGFKLDDQVYHLMPKNIEHPLEEVYQPSEDKIPSEVDLRSQFTRVKDQGKFGSCSAFAIVSIYEHILKKNTKKDVDLSELYAYHGARQLMDGENIPPEGTSLYHVIKAIGEQGICLENLHPYRDNDDEEPSEEAKKDAETRKIKTALNVECNIDHIKSAVAKGYPVAISLRVFDSFVTDTGFVPRPTEDERKTEDAGSHAMVICGYSDEQKVFIVRNSWGERFGDRGYCYIPYSYIGDRELLNCACIITEINMAEMKVGGLVGKMSVSFNKADAKVHAAILKTQIDEEQDHLKVLEAELDLLRKEYLSFVTRLGVPEARRRLRNGTEERLKLEIAEKEDERRKLIEERTTMRDEFESSNRKIAICSGLVIAGMIIVYTLLMMYSCEGIVKSYLKSGIGIFNAIQVLGIISFFASPIITAKTRRFLLNAEASDKYDSHRSRMWTIWFITVFVMIAAYVLLSLYKVITPWPIGVGWRWLILVLSFLPFVDALYNRRYVGYELDEEYQRRITKAAKEKQELEQELSLTKMKMHIAGRLLDSVTSLITNLTQKYYSIYSYVKNLRQWYDENQSSKVEIPANRQPFMSLVNSECLDVFFENHADDLTDEIRLYKLFKTGNYEVSDNQIVAFKNNLKNRLEEELMNKVSDFSMTDYVLGDTQYEYVNDKYVDINKLLKLMDKNSEIFVHTHVRAANGQGVRCKMIFREGVNSQKWNENVANNFAFPPTAQDVQSQYKLFVVRIEGLRPDEIAMLK